MIFCKKCDALLLSMSKTCPSCDSDEYIVDTQNLFAENERLRANLRDIRFDNRVMKNTLRDLSLELDKCLGEKKGG